MKKNKLYNILTLMLSIVCIVVLTSCDPDIKPGLVPSMVLPSDSLVVDLNELNHPPFICVVNSETGLKSIQLFVQNKDGQQEKLDKTITTFYNIYSHSINIKPVFTVDMRKIIIVATDIADQVTTSEYKLNIIPLYGLPEVHFSDGSKEIEVVKYVEGDESPDVFAVINSEEKINYVIFYQEKGLFTQMINDTVKFFDGEKQATINLKTEGDGYDFERGLTALKVKVVVGARNKTNEALLKVDFRAAIKVHLDQTEELFNGIAKDADVPFSGTLEVATKVQSLTYKLLDRSGAVIAPDQNVAFTTTNTFASTFTAHPTLGSVVFNATTIDGKTDEFVLNVHVGYKLLHVLASLSGSSSLNHLTSPGCFFSAEKERIFDYCGGRDNSEFVEVGFSSWNSYADIRVQSVDYGNKFRSITSCSPNTYETSVQDWPTVNSYSVSASSISYANFHNSTITELEGAALGSNVVGGVPLVITFATNPKSFGVPIYQTMIDGVPKKVIIAFDKVETINAKTPIYSTFWFYAKVQL